MSKFNLLILCIAMLAIGNIKAISMSSMIEFYMRFGFFMDICSKEHGVADKDIIELGNTGNVDNISESYLQCILVQLNMVYYNGTLTAADDEGRIGIFFKDSEDKNELLKTKAECATNALLKLSKF